MEAIPKKYCQYYCNTFSIAILTTLTVQYIQPVVIVLRLCLWMQVVSSWYDACQRVRSNVRWAWQEETIDQSRQITAQPDMIIDSWGPGPRSSAPIVVFWNPGQTPTRSNAA